MISTAKQQPELEQSGVTSDGMTYAALNMRALGGEEPACGKQAPTRARSLCGRFLYNSCVTSDNSREKELSKNEWISSSTPLSRVRRFVGEEHQQRRVV